MTRVMQISAHVFSVFVVNVVKKGV